MKKKKRKKKTKSYNNKKLMDTSSASLITPKIYLVPRKLHYFFFPSSDPILFKNGTK